MIKSRTVLYFFVALTIIALGGSFYFYSLTKQEPAQLLPATVNRDCAPWDGAAFTVSIQYDPATIIIISIWQSPNIPHRSTFSFPDNSGQVGNAYIAPALSSYVELDGEVSFQRVEEGMPLEGRFNFTSERGERFDGRFTAEWGSQVVYCG
jgi:hypothetical protein